jgi:hypothetical protein
MRVLVCIATVLIAAMQCAAEEAVNSSKGQGYMFFAPGVGNIGPNSLNLHIGAGGEGFIYKGLALGVEIGGVGPWPGTTESGINGPGFADWVVGLGSANISYHVLPKTTDRKLEPFLTAGYSLFFRAGVSHGTNVGGGANLWLRRNVATRFEVRTQQTRWRDSTGFRIGVTFR